MDSSGKLSRREFLQVAGATGAAVALTGFPFRNLKSVAAFERHPQERPTFLITKKIPQVCARACEVNCAFYVAVGTDPKTGLERALTIEGMSQDPIAQGKYCIKALGYVDSLYDPDRLMVTLKRTNPKKGTDYDPGWVTVRTDDAVKEIINVFKTHKREEILIASPGDPATNKLCRSLGVTRSDQRTECFGTHYYINCLTVTNPPNKYYSSTYTPSHHVPGFDFDLAKYQIWFGLDSFTKCGKAGLITHWVECRKNGGKVVMFNPVRTPLADNFATELHSIKPGTDLAVALAIMNVILTNKKYDLDFLKKYSDAPALVDEKTKTAIKAKDGGFYAWCLNHKRVEPLDICDAPALEGGSFAVSVDGHRTHAKPVFQLLLDANSQYTPEWAAPLSEVPAEVIRRIALELAAAAPYAMIPSNKRDAAGPNYANSWRLRHAISVINTLIGSIDHEGGVLLLHGVKIPWLEDLARPVEPYPPLPVKQADFRHEFPVTNDIYRNKDFSAPGHYGMLGFGLLNTDTTKVVFFRNPHRGLYAFIQPQMVEKGLERMDLVVDWNLYLDDIGYWCDYVLPAPHQYEESKLDIRSYYPKYACLVGGSAISADLPGDQIGWGSLAKAMGMALAPKYWTTDGSGDPKKAVPTNITDVAVKGAGAAENTKEFMKKGGFWIDKTPYQNYKQIREIGYGSPNNGRVRMYIDEFALVKHEPLPIWAARWTAPEGKYKFSKVVTRAPWIMHADPNFVNNPILKIMTTKNYMDCVWINPEAAGQLGLKEGDEVILENDPKYMQVLPRPMKAKLHLSKRILREDCVLMFHGLGHRARNLTVARDWAYRDGDLTPQKYPAMSKKHDPTGMGWVEDVYLSIRKA
ncbi:MAG: molybdopterin-dependent oxidoreductase [Nitrospirae bacterium]|nr:molybdopterin-dependent oxidoreductase [Nitrospirota bacterium]